jgi:hypothetical protein
MKNLVGQGNAQQDSLTLDESNGAFSNEVTVKIIGQAVKSDILSEMSLKFRTVPSKIKSKQLDRLKAKLNKRSGRP